MDTIKLEQIIREKCGNTGAIIVQKNGVSVYEYYENECTLNKGKWNGKQILSEKWIEESTAASDTDNYGYLFWRGEYNSYRADGKYSQISMILPDKNAVISMVAECRNGEELMSALYDLVCAKL